MERERERERGKEGRKEGRKERRKYALARKQKYAKIEFESDDLAQIPYLVFFTTGSKTDNCFKTISTFL